MTSNLVAFKRCLHKCYKDNNASPTNTRRTMHHNRVWWDAGTWTINVGHLSFDRFNLTHKICTTRKAYITFATIMGPNCNLQWKSTNVLYWSGTVKRCCICSGQTLGVYSPDGSTFLHEMMMSWPGWPPSWKCDIKPKIWLCQLMHIYLQNNPAKFHCDLIWNNGVLGFFEEVVPTRTTRWVAIWDQFLIHKKISNTS